MQEGFLQEKDRGNKKKEVFDIAKIGKKGSPNTRKWKMIKQEKTQ